MPTRLFTITILVLVITTPIFSQSWRLESLSDMPIARFGHCSVVYQDKVLIFGGKSQYQLGRSIKKVDCYNLQTNNWESGIPDLIHPRFDAVSLVYEDKIFVIGGRNDRQILNSVECYDPIKRQWEEVEPLLYPREGASAVVFEGKLYVIGGLSSKGFFQTPLDNVEYRDDSTKPWQESTIWKLDKPRVFMQSVVIDSFVYTLGGLWFDEQLDLNERFGWTRGIEFMTPLPSPRFYFSAVTLQNQIYLIGGIRIGDFGVLHDSIDVYDPMLNNWFTLENIKIQSRAGLTAVSYKGAIYIFGGIDANLQVLNTVERLSLIPTDVSSDDRFSERPGQHQLFQNYPNPFNSMTTIRFQVARQEPRLMLVIFNLKGEPVRSFVLSSLTPGTHELQWDGCDEHGRTVESGIYLAQLRSDRFRGPVLKLSFIK